MWFFNAHLNKEKILRILKFWHKYIKADQKEKKIQGKLHHFLILQKCTKHYPLTR